MGITGSSIYGDTETYTRQLSQNKDYFLNFSLRTGVGNNDLNASTMTMCWMMTGSSPFNVTRVTMRRSFNFLIQ